MHPETSFGATACAQDPREKHVNTLVDYAYVSDGDFVLLAQHDVGAVSFFIEAFLMVIIIGV